MLMPTSSPAPPAGRSTLLALIVGDAGCILLATLLGFARHDELQADAWPRFLATFVSFAAAWAAVAGLGAVYARPSDRRLDRMAAAAATALVAAPLGGVLRAIWLGSSVLPVFVIVMGGVIAFLVVVWRLAFEAFAARRSST